MIQAMATLLLSTQVTLTLAPEARVRGTEIRLGEVAELAGDAAAIAKLADFTIGYAPSPGFNRLLQGWRLEQNIERDNPGVDVVLAGTTACRVWPATTIVTAEELERAAQGLLEPLLAAQDATAVLASALRDVEVPAGHDAPVVRPAVADLQLNGAFVSIPVRIDIDGAPYRTIPTEWRVEAWQVLPVLVRDVPAGATLDFSMIENRRVAALRDQRVKPLPAGLAVGSVAAHNLSAGSIVTEGDLHRPKIVAAGDRIYLSIKKGPVVAKVAAKAMDDGAIGQRIRVATENQRELMAVVIGRDLVELDLTPGS